MTENNQNLNVITKRFIFCFLFPIFFIWMTKNFRSQISVDETNRVILGFHLNDKLITCFNDNMHA